MAQGAGPLAGVRVVELAGLGPAPFACMLLSQLGADVIAVERPGGAGALYPPELNLSISDRPRISVDLKRPEGVGLVRDLAGGADVFVEGYRPGVAERLGLGPDDLAAENAALVYARMTGWGQTGPRSREAGHDVNYLAATGVLHAIGPEERPAIPLNLVGDNGGGALYLVVGVLAALLEARASGRGQVVDAAIVDGALHLATPVFGLLAGGMWSDQRQANLLDGGTPFYDVYEAGDGRHVAVGPLEPPFYATFTRLLGVADDLPDRTDVAQWPLLRERIADVFRSRPAAHWEQVFAGSDACVTVVNSLREAAADPHLAARASLVEHRGMVRPAPAPRFSRTPGRLSDDAVPPLAELLAGWGVSDPRRVIDSGVVRASEEDGS